MEMIPSDRLQESDITEQEKQYVNGCRQAVEVPPFATLSPKPYLRVLSTLLSSPCSSKQNNPTTPSCNHAFVEIFNLGQNNTQPKPLTLTQMRELPDNTNALLFLKGQPCSDWIRAIGAKLGIDYDFFSQHLPFHEDCFYDQSSSNSGSTIRLRLPILGSRQLHRRKGDPTNYSELDSLRRAVDTTVSEYFRTIAKDPTEMVGGESLVRNIILHDEQHFSIDQHVSIHVCQRPAGWIGVIWTDVGYFDWRCTAEVFSHLQPLSSYHALKTYPTIGLPVLSEYNSKQLEVRKCPGQRIQQTASVIMEHYGKQVDQVLALQEPLVALFPIIQLCITAESQHLRMIETGVGKGSELISLTAPSTGLSIVLETKQRLLEHLQIFQDLAYFLRNHRQNHQGYTSSPEPDSKSAAFTDKLDTVLLLTSRIINKTQNLINECNYTVSNIQAAASLQQTERTIAEARGVKYLTVLAFFFAPLSFTTSFFGMNFKEFGTGKLSLYIWAVTAVPVSLLFIFPFLSDLWLIAKLAVAKISSCTEPSQY